MENRTQIKAIIYGRVQGVFFRVHTKDTAEALGVKGYVKNLPDGCVEAVFEGDPMAVEKALAWCHKGPAASRVERVLTETIEEVSHFNSFDITY